eukprot:888212-Pleurochrysis_carterae.AAC.1
MGVEVRMALDWGVGVGVGVGVRVGVGAGVGLQFGAKEATAASAARIHAGSLKKSGCTSATIATCSTRHITRRAVRSGCRCAVRSGSARTRLAQ